VRQTLLLEADDLSLSRAFTIALQVESTVECAARLTKQQVATSSQVAPSDCLPHSKLQPRQSDALDPDSSAVMQLGQQQCFRPRSQQPCSNCGSLSHASRAQNCPAHGQTCCSCGKQNHFAAVCQSSSAGSEAHALQYTQCELQRNLNPAQSASMMYASLSFWTPECCYLQSILLFSAAIRTLYGPLWPYGDFKIDLVGSLQVKILYGAKTAPGFGMLPTVGPT